MLENNPESNKLTIQRLASTLKSLEKKYNEVKADRTSLLKFVEKLIPGGQLETKVGQIDSDRLIASYKSLTTTKIKLENELKQARERIKNLEEDNENLKSMGMAMKLKIEENNQKIFKLETELKDKANLKGDALLSKIKSIGSVNHDQKLLPVESLEERNRAQAELITSLRSQLASIQATLNVPSVLERRECQVQTDRQYFEDEQLSERVKELQESLKTLQCEYNVLQLIIK